MNNQVREEVLKWLEAAHEQELEGQPKSIRAIVPKPPHGFAPKFKQIQSCNALPNISTAK